jgi:hypothetical protein
MTVMIGNECREESTLVELEAAARAVVTAMGQSMSAGARWR